MNDSKNILMISPIYYNQNKYLRVYQMRLLRKDNPNRGNSKLNESSVLTIAKNVQNLVQLSITMYKY